MRPTRTDDDEVRFFADTVGLRRRLDAMYVESRALAQAEEWRKHLDLAMTMVPCLAYLNLHDWVARILGRMAWSYVKLGDDGHAITLLDLAERHDMWQAAAGYYWAAEYSHRSGLDALARRCVSRFREVCFQELHLPDPPTSGDLRLAVAFYAALVRREEQSGSFQDQNNQSDKGRYHELRGRLLQDVRDFEMAARYYDAATLSRYAACCRGFAEITRASRSHDPDIQRGAYESALQTFESTNLFVDPLIREVLVLYCQARLALAAMVRLARRGIVAAEDMPAFESACKNLVSIVMGGASIDDGGLVSRAVRVPTLSGSVALIELLGVMDELRVDAVPEGSALSQRVEGAFDRLQKVLPSFTFLATREEQ